MKTNLYSAFLGTKLLATGPLADVLESVRTNPNAVDGAVVFFEHATGRQSDHNWQVPLAAKTGPGRPKLGVVSTEVTLLPRHWEWLNAQPGRASGTLRKLVEDAMENEGSDPKKRLESLGRLLWAVAGNEPNFEEASRALYAGDRVKLLEITDLWSGDLPAFVRAWE